MGLGFAIGVVGVLILGHAAYSTIQYRGLLKITEDEFSGPRLSYPDFSNKLAPIRYWIGSVLVGCSYSAREVPVDSYKFRGEQDSSLAREFGIHDL